MTNRERLMVEMEVLDNLTLYRRLSAETSMDLDSAMCLDCKREYGGVCPYPGDDECKMYIETWLDREWSGKPILRGGST